MVNQFHRTPDPRKKKEKEKERGGETFLILVKMNTNQILQTHGSTIDGTDLKLSYKWNNVHQIKQHNLSPPSPLLSHPHDITVEGLKGDGTAVEGERTDNFGTSFGLVFLPSVVVDGVLLCGDIQPVLFFALPHHFSSRETRQTDTKRAPENDKLQLFFAGAELFFAGAELFFAGAELFFAVAELFFAGAELFLPVRSRILFFSKAEEGKGGKGGVEQQRQSRIL